MKTPTLFGWYHISCLVIVFILLFLLYKTKDKHNEKRLKIILGTYGIIALILEILKQIIWSFNYDITLNLVTWDYQWYAFPFQLCTTPIYISVICLFLKPTRLRDYLLSYMAFFTILGSISTMVYPTSCFVSDILVNIHTMYLHLGSFIVSVYLLMTNTVKTNIESLKKAIIVFISFIIIANTLNIIFYNSGILNGETFNMFYISPHFISSLPVFNVIQENVPYTLFLIIYIVALILGAFIIYYLSKLIKYLFDKGEK